MHSVSFMLEKGTYFAYKICRTMELDLFWNLCMFSYKCYYSEYQSVPYITAHSLMIDGNRLSTYWTWKFKQVVKNLVYFFFFWDQFFCMRNVFINNLVLSDRNCNRIDFAEDISFLVVKRDFLCIPLNIDNIN